MQKVTFIGLGNMGGPMALNLLKARSALTVFSRTARSCQPLAEAGAVVAADVAEAVKDANVVITMLPDTAQVRQVYLGDQGVIACAKEKALLIDCSTINADAVRDIAKIAESKGLPMIDAPVSGGVAGAQGATLTFIVGGAAEALEKARPILETMGKTIIHAGDAGAGQVAKICNNMLLGILMIGTSEALNLGIKNGLDPKILSSILMKSSARNGVLELYNPVPGVVETSSATRGYTGGFRGQLMLKDLNLAQEAAHASDAKTPLGRAATELYRQHAVTDGHLDFASIFKMLAKDDKVQALSSGGTE